MKGKRMVDSSSNVNYNSMELYFDGIERGSKEWYRAVKNEGFKYMYRWVNSDESWQYFAKTKRRAECGAIKLYANVKDCSLKEAAEYYRFYIDVIPLTAEIINDWGF